MVKKQVIFGRKAKQYREMLKREAFIKGGDHTKFLQESVAKRAGIRPSHLSAIENGTFENIFLATALNICNALNVSFDELIVKTK